MENKIIINYPIKIEKNNPDQDIDYLKKLFSLKNYHYKDITDKKKDQEVIYRWPLLSAFKYSTKRS